MPTFDEHDISAAKCIYINRATCLCTASFVCSLKHHRTKLRVAAEGEVLPLIYKITISQNINKA